MSNYQQLSYCPNCKRVVPMNHLDLCRLGYSISCQVCDYATSETQYLKDIAKHEEEEMTIIGMRLLELKAAHDWGFKNGAAGEIDDEDKSWEHFLEMNGKKGGGSKDRKVPDGYCNFDLASGDLDPRTFKVSSDYQQEGHVPIKLLQHKDYMEIYRLLHDLKSLFVDVLSEPDRHDWNQIDRLGARVFIDRLNEIIGADTK